MKARIIGVIVTAVLLSVVCCTWAGASPELRPEWLVGQEGITPEMLILTPPIPAPATLTVQEAVEAAFTRNTGFRSTVNSLISAQVNLVIAEQRWSLGLSASNALAKDSDTTASAGAALSYRLLTGADLSISSVLTGLAVGELERSLSASISQPLLQGWGHDSGAYQSLRTARNSYKQSLLSFYTSRQSLISSVMDTYFSVVRGKQSLSIQKESVAMAEQQVQDSQLRYDEGLIIELDLLRAQQNQADAQFALIQAEESFQASMDRFLIMLGMQIGGNPDLISMVDYQPEIPSVEEATARALELRPELFLAQISVEDSQENVRISRARRLPTLSLGGGVSSFGTGSQVDSWNVGLAASFPLGDRSIAENYRQARWGLTVAQQALYDTRQDITLDIRAQVRSAVAAKRNVALAEERVRLSEKSYQQARLMAEEGLSTNREAVDQQKALTQSKLDVVNSKTDYFFAVMRLKMAMGEDVSALLDAISTSPATPAPETSSVTPTETTTSPTTETTPPPTPTEQQAPAPPTDQAVPVPETTS